MGQETDYYKVGTRENIVISNSSLSYIDPNKGGSPQNFLSFFDSAEEKERSYYRMGSLIHKWAEDREAFTIGEVDKPSDKLGEVADACLAYITSTGDISIELEDLILEACRSIGWNRKWGDDAIKKNACPSIKPYLEEIVKAENAHKIYLTKKESEVVSCCVESIEKHPLAKELLFMQDTDFSDVKVYKELEIYWEYSIPVDNVVASESNPIVCQFKAKLDSLVIDFDKKKIIYTDPKTSSKGAYNFSESFEEYEYYRQLSFYRWAIKKWCKTNNIDITDFSWKFYNIVIETNKLFQVVVYEISNRWLEKGMQKYISLVKRIAEHQLTNQWNYSLEEVSNLAEGKGLVLEIPFKEE